jgi:hypothetical protein
MCTAGGQRAEPPRAAVGFVAAAPPATVDIEGDRRVVVRWPVDVQCQVRSAVRREYHVLFHLHIHHLPCAFLAAGTPLG